MKVYNKDGASMNAAPEQMSILEANGWSRTKPEKKEDPVLAPDSDSKKETVPKPKPAVKVKVKTKSTGRKTKISKKIPVKK